LLLRCFRAALLLHCLCVAFAIALLSPRFHITFALLRFRIAFAVALLVRRFRVASLSHCFCVAFAIVLLSLRFRIAFVLLLFWRSFSIAFALIMPSCCSRVYFRVAFAFTPSPLSLLSCSFHLFLHIFLILSLLKRTHLTSRSADDDRASAIQRNKAPAARPAPRLQLLLIATAVAASARARRIAAGGPRLSLEQSSNLDPSAAPTGVFLSPAAVDLHANHFPAPSKTFRTLDEDDLLLGAWRGRTRQLHHPFALLGAF
jgi:hypothetical protein